MGGGEKVGGKGDSEFWLREKWLAENPPVGLMVTEKWPDTVYLC